MRDISFHELLDHAPDGIIIVDGDGSIVLYNTQAMAMFGYNQQELCGRPIEVLVPENLRMAHVGHREHYSAMPQTRPIGVGLDLAGRRKDGSQLPVEVSLSPVRSGGDRLIICIVRDVSERKLARIELERQAARLAEQAHLIDLAYDAILVRDMEGTVTFWNQGAEVLYGWSKDEALGRKVSELLKTNYPWPIEEIEGDFIRLGRWEGELVHTKRDGSRIAMASRWVLQRDDDGRPVAVLEDLQRHHGPKAGRGGARDPSASAGRSGPIGSSALADIDLSTLLAEATLLVSQSLAVEYSSVVELLPDGAGLLLRAGIGWAEGLVGRATLRRGRGLSCGPCPPRSRAGDYR